MVVPQQNVPRPGRSNWLVRRRQLELIGRPGSGRLVRLDTVDSPGSCADLDHGIRGPVAGMPVWIARAVDPCREPCGAPSGDRA